MKSLLSVLALAFGALTFQSCEYYPNGASRGYYHGDHSGDGYYDGGSYYDGGYFLKSSCLLPNAHIGSPA
jgi:hypothetical protein